MLHPFGSPEVRMTICVLPEQTINDVVWSGFLRKFLEIEKDAGKDLWALFFIVPLVFPPLSLLLLCTTKISSRDWSEEEHATFSERLSENL